MKLLPAFQREPSTMESDSTAYSLMSLQRDIPDELPSWDFAEDVLGGFDQFLDVSSFPQVNEDTSAVRREQAPAAAEPAGPSVSDADELASRPSSSRSDPDGKKQRQNRQAQQRFRQRQRVRCGCTFTPAYVPKCTLQHAHAAQEYIYTDSASSMQIDLG